MAAYFFDKHVDISKAELPFFFITGDEQYYKDISVEHIE
jgi:hypothetical protein